MQSVACKIDSSSPTKQSTQRNDTACPVALRDTRSVSSSVQPSVRARSSCSNSGICRKRERNGPSRTQTAACERIIHNVRELRLRRDPWPGQQQMQVKRTSNERPQNTDQTSTRPQRNVNATSTERQPNVNKASTEQQRVINPTIDSHRTAHIQRRDEARAAIRDRWLRRVSVRPSQRVVLTPLCSTFA